MKKIAKLLAIATLLAIGFATSNELYKNYPLQTYSFTSVGTKFGVTRADFTFTRTFSRIKAYNVDADLKMDWRIVGTSSLGGYYLVNPSSTVMAEFRPHNDHLDLYMYYNGETILATYLNNQRTVNFRPVVPK